jgi:ankyrin repeat protein
MKNPYIIPTAMICAAILAGFWMLKSPSEPQKVIVVQPLDISIHMAASAGNIEVVKQHLAAGTDVNAKDKLGWTPLHEAAVKGQTKVAELLIAAGADVNAKTGGGGWTPLDAAIINGNAETADLIRKHGGKTDEE